MCYSKEGSVDTFRITFRIVAGSNTPGSTGNKQANQEPFVHLAYSSEITISFGITRKAGDVMIGVCGAFLLFFSQMRSDGAATHVNLTHIYIYIYIYSTGQKFGHTFSFNAFPLFP